MKTMDHLKRNCFLLFFIPVALYAMSADGFCAQVKRTEAIAVADLWYAMEINSKHTKMDPAEKAARLDNIRSRRVLCLVSEEDLVKRPPRDGKVLGYIVLYEPTGFVVVSGEDRMEPVLVFEAEGTFSWEQHDQNFMRYYLKKALVGNWENLGKKEANNLKAGIHPNWSYLRSRLAKKESLQEATHNRGDRGRSVYVLWDTATWDQWNPYNDTVTTNNGNIAGIPTGCVATAMAIKMRFHEWPPYGKSSHNYTDNQGTVQFNHSVNFANQTYDWAAMPTTNIVQPNPDVADLMYHCGVAVEMNYEVGGSGAVTEDAPEAMEDYFYYKAHEWNTSNHEDDLETSIVGGLPALMRWPGHAMVADGYRDTGSTYFHVNLGWGGTSNGWYNLDNILGNAIAGSAPYSQPTSWIYVSTNGSPMGFGTLRNPYLFLSQGYAAVPEDGHLWLNAGSYSGVTTFDKAMTLHSYEGTVVID